VFRPEAILRKKKTQVQKDRANDLFDMDEDDDDKEFESRDHDK
jgi:hypothetical protein